MTDSDATRLPPNSFDQVPRAIWALRREGRVSGADIEAMAAIVWHAEAGRQLLLKSVNRLAAEIGWSKGNLQRCVKRLADGGLIVPVKHPRYNRQAYWIIWDPVDKWGGMASGRRPHPVDKGGEMASGPRPKRKTASGRRPKKGLGAEAKNSGGGEGGENGLGAEAGNGLDVEAKNGLGAEATHNTRIRTPSRSGGGSGDGRARQPSILLPIEGGGKGKAPEGKREAKAGAGSGTEGAAHPERPERRKGTG